MSKKREWPPGKLDEILHRYAAGESVDNIALNIIPGEKIWGNTIRNTLLYQGVELRPAAHEYNPVITDETRKRIVRLVHEGVIIEDVAAQCGVSRSTVKRTLRENSIALVPGRPKKHRV